jgi:hypothetical protein
MESKMELERKLFIIVQYNGILGSDDFDKFCDDRDAVDKELESLGMEYDGWEMGEGYRGYYYVKNISEVDALLWLQNNFEKATKIIKQFIEGQEVESATIRVRYYLEEPIDETLSPLEVFEKCKTRYRVSALVAEKSI